MRQIETGYSNFTLALFVAKQCRTLLLFYCIPIRDMLKAIFVFGDAAPLPPISRETAGIASKVPAKRYFLALPGLFGVIYLMAGVF